jgi:hypothetical protein
MKIGEIIRIIVFSIIGYVMMMLVQPWLYDSNALGVIKSIRFSDWLPQYNLAAAIVFGVSVTFTVLWYILTLINQNDNNRGLWKLIWYIGLGLLVVVISISIYFNNQYPPDHKNQGELIYETLFSLIGLFLFDSLFLLYWLPTVTSTPGLFKNRVVPGSNVINGIIGRK